MSALLGSNAPKNTTPDYTGLQIQTTVSTLPVPIIWGMARAAPNLIWYQNFQVHSGSSGGGGKGGIFNSGNQQTSYNADVILALCEGQIVSVNNIWRGQSLYTLGQLGLALFVGSNPQGVWNYLASRYPGQALAYQNTAYLAAANYQLTTSATLDNHNFEVQGLRYGSGYAQLGLSYYVNVAGLPFNGANPATGFFDADPALIINDFLTSVQFGVGFPSASIDSTTVFTQGAGNDAAYQTYCRALGLALSPALTSQEPAASILSRWLDLTNTAAVWSNGTLRLIPYGDAQVSGNGVTYVPSLAPIYNLGNDDYIVESGADPLQVSVSDLYQAYNVWRLECADRNNQYALTSVEARDQNAIELVAAATGSSGVRLAPTVTAHEICDPSVASIAGQLMLQRRLYIRNTYKFRLSWEYCLLDPMDLVTVSDAVLGLNNTAVRITEIDEDENGYLEVTAEEFPQGVASAVLYPTQTVANSPINRNQGVGSVNGPIIFEPTDELGGGLQIWAAVSNANALYGGCNVWVAYSAGGPYSWTGTLNGNSNMGATTADLPPVAVNPVSTTTDGLNTLAIDLTRSNGAVAAASQSDIIALDNPCYVGGEIVCFGTSTLTAANKYNLTNLARGVFGTESAIVDHPSGTAFARLDNVFKYAFSQNAIGQTLYFKFQSFNAWGGGVQSLADCAAYQYAVTGSALLSPLPNVSNVYSNYEAGFQKIYWNQVTDFRSGIDYEIRQGASWAGGLFMRLQAHPPFIAPGNGTYWIAARCQPVAGGPIVYSENPVSIVISGNQLSLTYSQTFDEFATGFSGSLDYGLNGGSTVTASLSLNTKAVAPAPVAIGIGSAAGPTCSITGVNVPAGALIVVMVVDLGPSNGGPPALGPLSDTVNGSYAVADSVLMTSLGAGGGAVFYFANSAALSGATITYATKAPGGNLQAMTAFYVMGMAAVSVLDAAVTASAIGNSTTPSVTSGVPGVANEMIVGALFFAGAAANFSQSAGFGGSLPIGDIGGSLNAAAGVAFETNAAAKTFAPTLSVAEPWGAIVLGFKPAANQVAVVSLPSIVTYGFGISDSTTPAAILGGTTVQSINFYSSSDNGPLELVNTDTLAAVDDGLIADAVGTIIDEGSITDMVATVTLSTNLPAGGVGNGDTLALSGVPIGVALYYEPPNSHWLTSACLANAAVNASAAFSGTLFNADFLGTGDFLNDPDFLGAGETSYIDGWVEIATASNIPSAPLPRWGRWQQFTPGVFPATAWKLRIGLESSSPSAEPTCSAFSFTTQLPTRTDNYVNKAVSSGGTTIVFTPDGSATAQPFNSGVNGTALPRVQVDWQATAGDTYTITGLSLSQLTIQFFNGGAAVLRTATIVVQGA